MGVQRLPFNPVLARNIVQAQLDAQAVSRYPEAFTPEERARMLAGAHAVLTEGLPREEPGSVLDFISVATGSIAPVVNIFKAELSGAAGEERDRVSEQIAEGHRAFEALQQEETAPMEIDSYSFGGFTDPVINLGHTWVEAPSFPVPGGGSSEDSVWPKIIDAVVSLGQTAISGAMNGGSSALSIAPTATTQAMATIPRLTGAGALVGTAVRGLRMGARAILVAISSRVGQRVTAKNVVALVKRVGPEAAAAALGVTVAEIMQVVTVESMKRRRRRGISARDISKARSTIRRVTGFMQLVGSACGPGSRRFSRRHRPGCACVVCRRG